MMPNEDDKPQPEIPAGDILRDELRKQELTTEQRKALDDYKAARRAPKPEDEEWLRKARERKEELKRARKPPTA